MPPRYVYWTIIVEGQPTAFRAREREELLPTLRQLQSRHPDAVMKWFAHGRLWDGPEEQRNAGAQQKTRERRGPGWRPGGQHEDPRERFNVPRAEKRRRFAEKTRRDRGDRPGDRGDRPSDGQPADGRGAGENKPAGGRGPFRPQPGGHRRPGGQGTRGGPWRPGGHGGHEPGGEPRKHGPGGRRFGPPAGRGPGGSGFGRAGGKTGESRPPGGSHGSRPGSAAPRGPRPGNRAPWRKPDRNKGGGGRGGGSSR